MPLSSAALAVARSWVGDEVASSVLDERFDRLGSVDLAIAEELRMQLSRLTNDQPATFSIPEGSASYGENINSLRESLKKLIAYGSGFDRPIGLNVTRLKRQEYR